jgi:hypothetical protein
MGGYFRSQFARAVGPAECSDRTRRRSGGEFAARAAVDVTLGSCLRCCEGVNAAMGTLIITPSDATVLHRRRGVMDMFSWKRIRPFTVIVCILMLTRLAAAQDTAAIRTEIISMQLGTSMEVRLKDKQKLRGARGAVADSGFTFVDARSGERQIAFADVASVKVVKQQSHTVRNVLIAVGIVAAVIGTIVGIGLATNGLGFGG